VNPPPDVYRPQPAYARSLGYVMQAGCIKVPADAVITQYAYVHLLELIAGGARPLKANTAGYRLLHEVLAPLTGSQPGEPPRAATVKCVAQKVSLADLMLERILGEPLDAPEPPHPSLRPWAHMLKADVDALLWLGECVRRTQLGTSLLEAARGAHDRHLGRPRRRRAPVEREWLLEQVDTVLWRAWWSLLHARHAGKLWLLADRLEAAGLDEDHRPTWQLDQGGR
jgi:hypothetical protein